MSDDIRTEARSLLEGLPSWGDGANWCDPSGQSIPIPKVTLRRLLHYILTDVEALLAERAEMNSIDFQGKTSWTCTCTHGGGGHMPACDMFVPTREQYAEACRERDQAREVVKAAVRFFDAYDLAGGLAATGAQAEALNDAIDAISVPSGTAGGIVRPWWMTT